MNKRCATISDLLVCKWLLPSSTIWVLIVYRTRHNFRDRRGEISTSEKKYIPQRLLSLYQEETGITLTNSFFSLFGSLSLFLIINQQISAQGFCVLLLLSHFSRSLPSSIVTLFWVILRCSTVECLVRQQLCTHTNTQ